MAFINVVKLFTIYLVNERGNVFPSSFCVHIIVSYRVCLPDKKETHTVTFPNFLENSDKVSYPIYTDLKCVINRTVYPMNI